MEGEPGSMSAYSLATRDMFSSKGGGPGPSDYNVQIGSILPRNGNYNFIYLIT
jgi:hypothetical protein